jgi:hypothetical protein
MANINITESNGLFTINLDVFEWTGLTVNGVSIPPTSSVPGVQYQYIQQTAGPLRFVATATQLEILHYPNCLDMIGTQASTTDTCMISYSESGGVITLDGLLACFPLISGSQASPMTFSQGNMTGWFQTI